MFDPKSDYALNKMAPDAIVYMDAAGEITRLTQADFSSLEEFQFWKAWSDENYHDTEKANHVFYNHTRSLHGLSEQAIAVPSPEDAMMEAQEQQERQELCRMLTEGLELPDPNPAPPSLAVLRGWADCPADRRGRECQASQHR